MIFDIQRFSTHDGTGIRTVIFFKGCPLRCAWCENPESQTLDYELLYDRQQCIACLDCTRVSPDGEVVFENGEVRIDRQKIKDIERYRGVCPAKALVVVGQSKSIEEILREIEKDLPFYRMSGGGVTLSGGEPYAQPNLLLELARSLKGLGLNVSVETCLETRWDSIERSLPYIDSFLADLKHTDAQKLKSFTGGNVRRILRNFRNLERNNAQVVVRVPVIPGFNTTDCEMDEIIAEAAALSNIREIHFLPFHTLGVNKYRLLAKEYSFLETAPELEGSLNKYLAMAQGRGLSANIGG